MSSFSSIFGIIAVLATGYLLSKNRRQIRWQTIFWGLGLQISFALLVLGIPRFGIPGVFRFVFEGLNKLVNQMIGFTNSGTDFLFGNLGKADSTMGFMFAFRALPTIIFFCSFISILYYLGILQKIVKGVAWVMMKTMKSSGAETLSAAANVFMGQTEAPLLVKPYIPSMTQAEIFCVMVGGMATIAAGVEAAYVSLLQSRVPDIAGHLLTASVLAAPGAILVSKLLHPETERPLTSGSMKIETEKLDTNIVEAASRGASEGVHLALNVAAMLVAFIGIVALLDALLGFVGGLMHFQDWGQIFVSSVSEGEPVRLSFALITGWLFRPIAWLIGIPWNEAHLVGQLLGQKLVINEFVAYIHLQKMGALLSDRSVLIASYALCGFANFSSIGIQIGGIGGLAPSQRPTMAQLGFRAVLGGTMASLLTASVAALFF